MIGVSLISSFSNPLDSDSIHMVDQDITKFGMIITTNLATHDSFIWPCSHVDPYDEYPSKDTY